MYLHSLKIFCDVVRHHSFSKGASVNDVSQSAASQAILQIEKTLGAELLDRSKRPWELTAQGKVFFDGAQDIVNRFVELQEAVRRRHVDGYRLRVAAIYSVSFQDMNQYVEHFKQQMPGCDVDLEFMHPDRVVETVLSNQADLGLLAFGRTGAELAVTRWREEAMVFACLPGHRLARARTIRPADLAGEKFVAFDRALAIRREVDQFLRREQVEVDVTAEFDSIANIKQAIEEGVGVSILPEPTFRREIEQRSMAAVPFAGAKFVRPLRIIYRKKRKLPNAALSFVALLTQESTQGKTTPGIGPAAGARLLGLGSGSSQVQGRKTAEKILRKAQNGSSRSAEKLLRRT